MKRQSGPALFWWLLVLAGLCLLPWHMQQDGVRLSGLFALFTKDAEAASALGQAVFHGRF